MPCRRRWGWAARPALAEDVLVARDCMLALHTGARVNIQHISSANSVQLVRLAKEMGAHVTAEATPHHFSLTEDAVLEKGTMAKMNPPLRTQADRYAIIEGLKDGAIDIIATDHAPHSAEEKAKPFAEAPSGIIGLETALALGIIEPCAQGASDAHAADREDEPEPGEALQAGQGRRSRKGPTPTW